MAKNESGSVYVEFSLVLPFLLLSTLLIYGSSTLLGSMSFLIPTAYESLLAGSTKVGPQGQAQMQFVSNLFVSSIENKLHNYSFQSNYTTIEESPGGAQVPVVHVQLDSTFVLPVVAPLVAAFSGANIGLELIGPQVAPDLSTISTNFESVATFTCGGTECGGSTGVSCPTAPCP